MATNEPKYDVLWPLSRKAVKRTAAVEDRMEGAYEELAVFTVDGMCRRLLHDEAVEAGMDPFVVVASPADRVAMLIERM